MDTKDDTDTIPTRSQSTNEVINNAVEPKPEQSKTVFSRRVVITLICLYLIGIALVCVGGVLVFKVISQMRSDKPLRTQEYLNFARLNELKVLPITSLQKASSLILQVDSEDQDVYRFYNVRGVEFHVPKGETEQTEKKAHHTTIFHLSMGHKLVVADDKATLIDSKDGSVIAEYYENEKTVKKDTSSADMPAHTLHTDSDNVSDTDSVDADNNIVIDDQPEDRGHTHTQEDRSPTHTKEEKARQTQTDPQIQTEGEDEEENAQLRTLIKKEYFKPQHGYGGGGGYNRYPYGGGYNRGYNRYPNYYNNCPYCGMYYGSPWRGGGYGSMFGPMMSMFGGLF